MTKKLFLLTTLLLFVMHISAQTIKVKGIVVDSNTEEPMVGAAVRCTDENEKLAAGTTADENGQFNIGLKRKGKYTLSVTIVGHKPFKMNCHINGSLNIGKIKLVSDEVMLSEAVVTGNAAKVVVSGDTITYNSAAYRVPEGSPVEELVRRLPGAKIDENGKITINGKEVKKILLNGKEFMTGDTETAMKNLPSDIVKNVRTYKKKSDMARITGVDDGEEEEVIDFGIKRGMENGVFANADVAYGNHDRYQGRVSGSKFNDKFSIMSFANFNNTNEAGFYGGKARHNADGLNTRKMIGTNINLALPKFDLDLGLRWAHRNGDVQSVSSSQNFVSNSSFGNAIGKNLSRMNKWMSFGRFEWRPDSMNNVMYRHFINFNADDKLNTENSATFSEDPFLYLDDPMLEESLKKAQEMGFITNYRLNSKMDYSTRNMANFVLSYNHKFGNKGRNINLRANFQITDSKHKDISNSNVHFFNIMGANGLDSTYVTNRYNIAPEKSYKYSGEVAYTEPIAKGMYVQLKYRYTRWDKKTDKMVYDFAPENDRFGDIIPSYRGWDDYISMLTNPLDFYIDNDLCRYSEHHNDDNKVSLVYKMIQKKFNLHAGVDIQNQRTHFKQDYQGINADTVRNVTTVSPSLTFRYKFDKMHTLNVYYYSYTQQPSMTDLMDITDDTDPLNIHKGNPGLKPSLRQNLWADYYQYIKNRNQSITGNVYFSTTRNSVANAVLYNEETGGRTITPENINGNWNLSAMLSYNTELDSLGRWNLSTSVNYNHDNYVNFFTPKNQDRMKNTTRNDVYSADFKGGYRNEWFEAELNGDVMYNHTRNELQANGNMDTWTYSYGTTLYFTLPWNMTLNTDMRMHSRRGFSDSGMNTNEFVWNAQITQALLKDKSLSLSLQFYDLLQKQSSFSRTITAMMRNDVSYNSINSYAMLHLIYKINIMGGKKTTEGPRGGRFGGRHPHKRFM